MQAQGRSWQARWLRFTTLTLLVYLPLLLALSAPGSQANASEDEQNLARLLIGEGFHKEALSFIDQKLASLKPGPAWLELRLLRTEALIATSRWDEAGEELKAFESMDLSALSKERVARLRFHLIESRRKASIQINPELLSTYDAEEELPLPPATLPLPLVSNSFFDNDIRLVLGDLSLESGVPIVWDPTVEGLITYAAIEKPLDEVLKDILVPLGYSFREELGTIYVGSSGSGGPIFGLLAETHYIHLANIAADEALELLSDSFKGFVKASDAENSICITAPTMLARRIEEDFERFDRPRPLIGIEVVVLEISEEGMHEFGVDWSITGSDDDGSWGLQQGTGDISGATLLGNYADPTWIVKNNPLDLTVALKALIRSGKASIRANPRITTLNGRKAEIGLSREQYFVIQTGSSSNYQYNTLQSVNSGITLEITPFTSGDGHVTLYLQTEVGDVIGKGTNDLPEISRRTASTSVRMKSGETFSVGGLSLLLEKKIERKLPLLGSIPLLGRLFRYESRDVKKSEIVIFVTPQILEG